MNIKSLSIILTSALLAAAAATSCSLKSTMTVSSYGIYMAGTYQGHSNYFVLDDSTLVFNSGSVSTTSLTSGSRVFLYWNYDSAQEGQNPMTLELTSYEELSKVDIGCTDRPDTLGTDGADLYYYSGVPYLWKAGGVYNAPAMITLGFEYIGNGQTGTHSVYLTHGTNPIDENGYYHLTFSHDAGPDFTGTSTTSCSFVLPEASYTSDIKGLIIGFKGIDTESEIYYKFDYATGTTQEIS